MAKYELIITDTNSQVSILAKGDQGPQGEIGPQGPQGTAGSGANNLVDLGDVDSTSTNGQALISDGDGTFSFTTIGGVSETLDSVTGRGNTTTNGVTVGSLNTHDIPGGTGTLALTSDVPTNNNQLTNGAGYITDYTVTQGDVTAHQGALELGATQITSGTLASARLPELTVTDFAGSAIVTESEGLSTSDNDTSIPTTAAVIDYVDGAGSVANDATITIEGGTGLVTTAGDFTTNQGSNETITVTHADHVTAGTVSEGGAARTLAYGDAFNVPSVTYNAQGHVTSTGTTALTLPASDNTDTTYSAGDGLTLNGTDFDVDLLDTVIFSTSDASKAVVRDSNGDFSAGTITADLIGDVTGSADTLTFTAKNSTGSTLEKGSVVYVSGINGNTPEVSLARANSSSTMPAFGLVEADIANTSDGVVTTFGSLTGLNVADYGETGITFSLGDTVYVSSSEAGKLTNVAPTGEANLIQNIGKIERAAPTTNMTIKVGGAGRTNATPNLGNGNFFLGNSSNQTGIAVFAEEVDDRVNALVTGGTGISTSYDDAANTLTFNHTNSVAGATVAEGGSTRSLSYGGSFDVPTFTFDDQGHISGTGTAVTLTLPASDNTDTTYSSGNGLSLTGTTFSADLTGLTTKIGDDAASSIGQITVRPISSTSGQLRLQCEDSSADSHLFTLEGPAHSGFGGAYTWKVPQDQGTAGQALVIESVTTDSVPVATLDYADIPSIKILPSAHTSAHTLVAADSGKHISITTGGVTVNTDVFEVGDAVSIYNNSGSNQTITQGTGATLRTAGTATTGNITLAQYGICTILCVVDSAGADEFVVSGGGIS